MDTMPTVNSLDVVVDRTGWDSPLSCCIGSFSCSAGCSTTGGSCDARLSADKLAFSAFTCGANEALVSVQQRISPALSLAMSTCRAGRATDTPSTAPQLLQQQQQLCKHTNTAHRLPYAAVCRLHDCWG